MRVLIIKMSSLGDIIHALPAITDAARHDPTIEFDWVVEENFAEIPRWHPHVKKVIPIALRRWRKQLTSWQTWREWRAFRQALRAEHYDLIIDAQGLAKSVWVAANARGPMVGFNRRAARGGFAAWCYRKSYPVASAHQAHAVPRLRHLFSQIFNYSLPTSAPDCGLDKARFQLTSPTPAPYLVFLHATTWKTKLWPESYWIDLGKICNEAGYTIKLPWGNAEEQAAAERIAAGCATAEVLPRQNLQGMAAIIAHAAGAVAVDTGLGHLAAALGIPCVHIYGPTSPALTGAMGLNQTSLAAQFPCAPCLSRVCQFDGQTTAVSPIHPPCFSTVPPAKVKDALFQIFTSPTCGHPHPA